MKIGNLSGLVSGTESVVFDYEVSGSPVSSISTGNILNGDEDGEYTIIVREIGGALFAATRVRFNNDSGANYGRKGIYADGSATPSDWSGTNETGCLLANSGAVGKSSFGVSKVYAKSGAVRMMNTIMSGIISTTTVTFILPTGFVWNNTADNITSMTFSNDLAGGIAVGSRIIILKSNNSTSGIKSGALTTPYIKGSWVRVASTTLLAPASSVTFNGLDGDRDVIYIIRAYVKQAIGTPGWPSAYCYPNGDIGSTYGSQILRAYGTTILPYRIANDPASPGLFGDLYGAQNGAFYSHDAIVFAKKGFVRPALSSGKANFAGTYIEEISVNGSVWNNTVDTITSLQIATASNAFDAGSIFELFALRPNG